ncbi:hypothetical protein [Mycolicibacterium chubuense]|uniref:hypothetical protein n=1 Tax=Mycolicibacterium chubuense TaxID=1800 RepID=UPI0013019757|nr:hypothetical protein [Mycolicibacterium chubuense]
METRLGRVAWVLLRHPVTAWALRASNERLATVADRRRTNHSAPCGRPPAWPPGWQGTDRDDAGPAGG